MADKEAEGTPQVNGADISQLKITLRKPVHNGDGSDVTELKFREPTAGDIEMVGNPVILDLIGADLPKVNFDAKSMTHMMARLANVPPSTIRQMHPKDWNSAAWMLTNFFMPDL